MLGHALRYLRLRVWKLAEGGVFFFGRGLGINLYEMFSIKSERLHPEWIFFFTIFLSERTDGRTSSKKQTI